MSFVAQSIVADQEVYVVKLTYFRAATLACRCILTDCPSGCTCSRLPGGAMRVQVKSDSLTSFPGYFPETTAVM